jgi:hypothetical protein
MPAGYLKDFQEEMRRVGDVVFKQRHRSPVLIVLGKIAELVDDDASHDKTMVAARSPDGVHEMALVNRVFPVLKSAYTQRGPVVLGRSGENDIAIPEFSISNRHCYFEFEAEGIFLTDCGSTNGTIVGDVPIAPGESVELEDGAAISLGRFAFSFRTATGFHAYVKSLLR